MAGGVETIKSHMVSLGFSVDQASYQEAGKSIDAIESMLTKFASRAVFEFGKAALAVMGLEKAIKSVKFPKVPHESAGTSSGGGSGNLTSAAPPTAPLKDFAQKAALYLGEATAAVATFATAVTGATAGVLAGLGNQEIQMEMLSRSMWTTQTQAMAFSLSLKALGASLQDLYLSPTLMAQYEKLHAIALQMRTPSNYNQQIKSIQNISLGFEQMQLEANYSLQWIGYYFTKYMAGPISQVSVILNNINTSIVKGMPNWTKQVAAVMASFMQAGIYIGQALGTVYSWLVKMLNYMPGWAKGIAAAIAMLTIVMDANPFGQFMLALSAVILLFDDFETYIHGGKSALSGLWGALETTVGWFNKFRGFGAMLIGIASAWGIYKGAVLAASVATDAVMALQTAWRSIMIALGIATEGDVAAQLAVNAAMDANPVGLLITFIGLLIGALILVVTHWKQVEKWGVQAWGAIKSVALDMWSSITSAANSVWKGIQAIFTGVEKVGTNAWNVVLNAANSVWKDIQAIFTGVEKVGTNAWNVVLNAANSVWKDIQAIFTGVEKVGTNAWNAVLNVANSVWKGIQTGFANAINFVISMFDNVIKMIDLIPGIKIPIIPLVQFGANASTATGYVYPQGASTSSTYTTHVTVNNTIHGATDPNKTAAAIHHTFNKALHNVRGVIG
jgi:phage-related protein